jgi:2-polyprenyl-3-methyl-5-hydroxy-6-metoxy-1,4-benzoquinol methylase
MRNRQNGIPQNAGKNTHAVVETLLFERGRPEVVLDIPCGHGAFSKRLINQGIAEVHAADCLELIQLPDVTFRVADMNKPLPYEDNCLDAVTCIEGIEHLERPFDFVRECRRILKPRGTVIITTPNASSVRSRWRWFLTGFHNKCKTPLDETNPSPSHHIGLMSLPELRYLLHTNGFDITTIRTNRIKAISWIYLPICPLLFLVTLGVFCREEKDKSQRARNRGILVEMFSLPVLLGEALIVGARRSG